MRRNLLPDPPNALVRKPAYPPCKRRKLITQLADSGSTFGAGDADAMVTAVDVCTMDAVKELPFMAFARIDFNMPGCFKIVPIGEVIWLPMVENIDRTGLVKRASNG